MESETTKVIFGLIIYVVILFGGLLIATLKSDVSYLKKSNRENKCHLHDIDVKYMKQDIERLQKELRELRSRGWTKIQ